MPAFEIQPNTTLLEQTKIASENLLRLAQPLADAPEVMTVAEYIAWSAEADATMRGILYNITSLRAHYARFIRVKDGTLVDQDNILGL